MIPIDHHIFKNKAVELKDAMKNTAPGVLIAIIGCSGVGKTVLRRYVLKTCYNAPCYWADNVTPFIDTMAILASGSYFNSRHFVFDLKKQVLFPDLSWMLDPRHLDSEDWIIRKIEEIRRAKAMLPALRWTTEAKEWDNLADICETCRCEWISIDHATCMLVNHKNKIPADHLFNLASWSERHRIRIILTGIETMPALWARKAELRRRIKKIWIPPYPDDREGIKKFARVVASLLKEFDAESPTEIIRMTPELHMATGGIIGELKRLFVDSAKDGRPLSREGITSCYYTQSELRDLWDGIRRFHEARKISSREELYAAKQAGLRRKH